MWNARSQAANHGYSHLSGIEMMSRLKEVRPVAIAAELSRWPAALAVRIAVEPVSNDVVVELFAPQQARVSLPRDVLRLVVRFLAESLAS